MVPRAGGLKENGASGLRGKRNGISFQGYENVLKLTVVIFLQLCECTDNHQIVHFKWVSCMAYELYLNKVLIKKKRWLLVLKFLCASELFENLLK